MTGESMILFPTPPQGPLGTDTEPASPVLDGELLPDDENTALVARRSCTEGLQARVAALVRGMAQPPQLTQLKAVAGYRLRHAPRDVARLVCAFLRGHGRWIAKGWTWATHGDLRADTRAARLAGDQEARRTAQETLRADALTRWAKVGRALHRTLVGWPASDLPRRGPGPRRRPGTPGGHVAPARQPLHGARRTRSRGHLGPQSGTARMADRRNLGGQGQDSGRVLAGPAD